MAFQMLLGDETPVLMYVLRIAMAFLAARVFAIAAERRDPVVDWVVCGVGVLALAQIMPIPYLGFGYIAAAILACTGAFPAAALAGLALDMARITPVPMTAVICPAWLVRLIPGGRKKWMLLVPTAVTLPTLHSVPVRIEESAACAVWFVHSLGCTWSSVNSETTICSAVIS